MIYTFWITTASSIVYQVNPLNWLDCSLIDEPEKDQQFYRRKFNGNLTFGGKKLCVDFDLFYALELADPFQRIEILILQNSNVYWEGYFSTANGTFNLHEQTFTVTPKTTDDYSNWSEEGGIQYNLINVTPTVTVECNGNSFTRNRWLIDCIEYLSDQIFPGVTVTTNFFTYVTDYVTLGASRIRYLTIAQKSDIKRPTSSNPATIAMMSFNEMMDILRAMFNVFWTYDLATDTLRLEHLSYFTATAGLDLTTQEIARDMLTYKRTTEEMPKYEKWNFMERMSADFIGSIWYDSPAVDSERYNEVFLNVTTEIEMIQNDANSVSDDGFVILANYLSGGVYYTYQASGIIDSIARFNMPLSWSFLLLSYHRHGRILLNGYFNVTAQEFVTAKKTILHDINAIVCPEHNYLPENYITTELGETYFGGLKGYVKKATIKPYGEINFNLMYGPQDEVNEGWSPTSKTLYVTVDTGTLEVRSELSEPNPYDTYYSIWTNDDTCDVIMIPAGIMIQDDILTQINPVVTIKYNFTDDSLIGWLIFVNGSTTFDTATEAECSTGSPPPPAVPDIPDIIGHVQSETCGPITVNWTAEADATYYVLQRKPDLGGNDNWITMYSGVNISFDDENAGTQEGVTFYYRAAAGNISGLSGWSAEHEVNDVMC